MDSSKPVSRAAPPLPDSKVKRRRRSQPRLASFTDVTASPAQRVDELERWVDHQVIDKGSVVFEQVASRHVPGALPRLATEVGKLTPEGGLPPALADEWWAGLIPSDVTIPVSLLDTWLAQSTAAERRQQVTAAAGVGHAIIEVEKAEVGQVVFKPDTQAALRKLLLQTVSTVLTSLDVEGDTALTERLVAEAIERTRAELLETAATPEAEAALGSLIDDTVMASKLIGDLLQLFGAAKSSQMPPDKRIAMLRDTATELGPVYVKLCQSVVTRSR
ncbi:MAG: hypothetical protein IPJ65_43410 [Archangiaceae bacterium]|nr:hypothetical protein [Archangiaceae bacterium]